MRACTEAPRAGDAAWVVARTVYIETSEGFGTGVVVSPDGMVLTAAHVVSDHDLVNVRFPGAKEKVVGQIVRHNKEADLAIVVTDQREVACLPVRQDPAPLGSDVLVVGSPRSQTLSGSVSKGIVSAYREIDNLTAVQTDASINSGNSGGPLVGESGELIGIVSFKVVGDNVEGLGFAIAATNIPAELSIRWGTETADALLNPPEPEDATPPSPPTATYTPTERSPQQRRRATTVGAGTVAGIALAAGTVELVRAVRLRDDFLDEPTAATLEANQRAYNGSMALFGVAIVGTGVAIAVQF